MNSFKDGIVRYLRPITIGSISVALLIAAPAQALSPSLGSLYVRARVAELAGDTRAANADFGILLTEAPANAMFATRAYRQALSAGDMALAVRAAHLLDAHQTPPADMRILLVLDRVKARDWVKARDSTEKLAQDHVFGFLAPYLRAWIAQGSGVGDPLVLAEGGRGLPLAAPYYTEQRALLLIAMGKSQEAAAGLGPQAAAQLPAAVKGPDQGLSRLLVQVATDFARQQFTPVGMILARMATYVAPDDMPGWFLLADLLRRMQRPDLALAALDHIDATDPLYPAAGALRIQLLNDSGRSDAALAEALAATKRETAGAADWARVGDLYLLMDKPGDAATAYAKAVALAEGRKAPPEALWPLLLQQGEALDLAGDWPHARQSLVRAYQLAPDQPTVLNQVGYAQIEHRENIAQASAMIEQASKLRPDDPAITDSLGWVLHLQGKTADAVSLLERAAAGDPGESAINEHLGDAYWTLGREYEARYAWRAALITAEDKDRSRLTSKIDIGLDKATAAP